MELFSGSPGEQNFFLESKGFYLQINNRTDKPFVKYSGITVETGKTSNVEVRKEVVVGVSYPYSDCRKDLTPLATNSVYYRYTASLTTYYQHLCIDIYFQLTSVVPNCGCYEANSPIYDNSINICDSNFTFKIIIKKKQSLLYYCEILALDKIECAKKQVQYLNTPVQ